MVTKLHGNKHCCHGNIGKLKQHFASCYHGDLIVVIFCCECPQQTAESSWSSQIMVPTDTSCRPYDLLVVLNNTRDQKKNKQNLNDHRLENLLDTSATSDRSPNLTQAFRDLDLWPPDPQSWPFMPLLCGSLVPICIIIGSFVIKISCLFTSR